MIVMPWAEYELYVTGAGSPRLTCIKPNEFVVLFYVDPARWSMVSDDRRNELLQAEKTSVRRVE